MIPIELTKFVAITAPELKDDGSPTLTYVDTKGWSHVRFLFMIGVTDIATTAAPTITECDTSGGSYAAITSPTTAALADAISATEDGLMFAIDVDLTVGSRLQFLQPTFVCGNGSNGTNVAIVAILSRPDSGSVTGLAAAGADGIGLEELVSA